MRQRARQQGFLLIAAVVLIVVGAVLATVIAFLYATSGQSGVDHLRSAQALFISETGQERGVRTLLAPPLGERIACASITGDASLTNVSYGKGEYTVTETNSGSTLYNGGTTASPSVVTLTANITASPTPIPVNVITGYARPVAADDPAGGRVLIDREVIDYSDISNSATDCGAVAAPCLLGVQRGRDGTTATSHTNGTRLGQYQCNLKSEGGVPTLTAADRGKRTVQQGVQLQEGWAVGVRTAGPPFTANFNGIFCFSTADECWAVGDGGIIIYWDGSTWTAVTSPTVTNLNDVTCGSTSDCQAVGDNGTIVRYTAGSWSTVSSPTGRNLNGVFMFDTNGDGVADDGWAVGDRTGGNFTFLRWNGTTWNLVLVPSPSYRQNLNDIDCVDVNYCFAVANDRSNRFVGVEWELGTWTPVVSALTFLRENLNGVSCVSSTNCRAVGNDRFGRFTFATWGGTSWSIDSQFDFTNRADLNDVYCADGTNCWAVGDRRNNNFTFARYDSSSPPWSIVTVYDPANDQNLNGVSCVNNDINDCWAVGNNGTIMRYDGSSWSLWGGGNATAQRWDSMTWTDVSTTLPGGINRLNGISMLSYADGWAVGNRTGGNATIVRWNGSSWVSNPPSPARNRNLFGVYAVSANDAWAVGQYRGCPPGNRITILRWNGTAWQCSLGLPSRTTVDENLRGVFMLDTNNDGVADDGWAVGDRRTGGNFTLLRWNNSCNGASTGTNAWAYCPLASINRQRLNSVFCVAADDCWAVGNNRRNRFIILRWNGTAWSDASVLDAANDQDLNDVYCTATDNCWAVGDRNGNNFTFVRWDGTNWSVTLVAAGGNQENLNGIACTTAKDCWAVGNELNNNYTYVHWNGSAWTAAPLAGAAGNDDLNGVAIIGHRQRPQSAWREKFP